MCNQVRQNYEPEAKNPFIEVNLALLTDLGGRISGDAHRKSEEETSIDLTNENSTFPCEEGYWEDTITVRTISYIYTRLFINKGSLLPSAF